MTAKELFKVISKYSLPNILSQDFSELIEYLTFLADNVGVYRPDYFVIDESYNLGCGYTNTPNGQIFYIKDKSVFESNPLKYLIYDELRKTKSDVIPHDKALEICNFYLMSIYKEGIDRFIYDVMRCVTYYYVPNKNNLKMLTNSEQWLYFAKKYPFFKIIGFTKEELFETAEFTACGDDDYDCLGYSYGNYTEKELETRYRKFYSKVN